MILEFLRVACFIFINCTFLLVFTNCSGSTRDRGKDVKPIEIDLSRIESVSIEEVFSSIELIPLSLSHESAIKNVHKLIYYNERYYVLDADSRSLFIFNKDGQYLFKINNVGNGPGEYSLLYDFNINKITNRIELLNPRGTLLEYTMEGDYLSTIKLPLRASRNFIDIDEDVILLFSKSEDYSLYYYSRSRDTIFQSDFKIPGIVLNTPMMPGDFSPLNLNYDGSINFFPGYNNLSYNIVNNRVVERIKWDFGKHNLKLEDIPGGKSFEKNWRYLKNCSSVHSFRYYLENEQCVFTEFLYNKSWLTLIYYKAKGEYRLIKKFKNNLIPPFNPMLFNNVMIYAAEPSQIQLFVNPEILDKKNKRIYDSIKIEDNPIIIMYHVK